MKIEKTLAQYPKEDLTRKETPLQHLPHLSAQLDVNFYLKRDDLTDLVVAQTGKRLVEEEELGLEREGNGYL